MSVRNPNHPRANARAVARAARKASRKGTADAAWLNAVAAGMAGCRF